MKKGLVLFSLAILVLFFNFGCMSTEEFSDTADDRVHAMEDLIRSGEDLVDGYEDVQEMRRLYSRSSYIITFVNRTCSEYEGKDEYGNRFIVMPLDITNSRVFAYSRGDEDVSIILRRTWSESGDCAGNQIYSGEVDRSKEVEID